MFPQSRRLNHAYTLTRHPGVPGQATRRPAADSRIFSGLGRALNEAATVRRVAEVILEAADELLGWDAASLDLYSPELDTADCVLAMDLIEGRRADVTPAQPGATPSPKMREVISHGAQIVLRESAPRLAPNSTPFGDESRPSASLLFVPIRCQERVMGVLTAQSYTPEAYAPEDLEALQALADHCGGALQRIQVRGAASPDRGPLSPRHRRRRGGALRL